MPVSVALPACDPCFTLHGLSLDVNLSPAVLSSKNSSVEGSLDVNHFTEIFHRFSPKDRQVLCGDIRQAVMAAGILKVTFLLLQRPQPNIYTPHTNTHTSHRPRGLKAL